ncbi:MAG: hypothetical protein QXE64_02075 [Candidatus Pacearchaeota archaeon]
MESKTGNKMEEREKEKVKRENLKKMFNSERGGMYYLLMKESVGGNAGYYGDKPCVAANFLYNEKGEIVEFTNYREGKKLYKGTFRIVVNPKGKKSYKEIYEKIVNVFLDKDSPKESQEIIKKCAEEYNKLE